MIPVPSRCPRETGCDLQKTHTNAVQSRYRRASSQAVGTSLIPMASRTTILTRHDVTVPGSDLAASMILDDRGQGHVMMSSPTGPSFSADASNLEALQVLITECITIRSMLSRPAEPSAAADLGIG